MPIEGRAASTMSAPAITTSRSALRESERACARAARWRATWRSCNWAAIARPRATVSVPSDKATIVLLVDVSGSMRAADVKPTRLGAAQEAVRTFLERVPKRVRVGLIAFSSDGGRTFGTPIRLDSEGTLGRVDVEMLPDGSAAAAYIDLTGNRAELRVRRVTPAGILTAPVAIATLANNRSSGYPRMAVWGDELVFAWVDRDNGSGVRTATARLTTETR